MTFRTCPIAMPPIAMVLLCSLCPVLRVIMPKSALAVLRESEEDQPDERPRESRVASHVEWRKCLAF